MALNPLQIGVLVWAEQTPQSTLQQFATFGLSTGQLGIPPDFACTPSAAAQWREALATLTLTTAVCAYAGEDYADLPTVHRTVGFTAPGYATERITRTKEIAAFAAQLAIPAVSCHIGFIPEDPTHPTYLALLAIARDLADACDQNNQSFVLETGQESAPTLLRFLTEAARPNLRVNFDPANMILYNSGSPIQALELLAPHILSVHCKDGLSPTTPGTLGVECPLGEGEVDLPAFLTQLHAIKFPGPLTIEREEPNPTRRAHDIRQAINLLLTFESGAPPSPRSYRG